MRGRKGEKEGGRGAYLEFIKLRSVQYPIFIRIAELEDPLECFPTHRFQDLAFCVSVTLTSILLKDRGNKDEWTSGKKERDVRDFSNRIKAQWDARLLSVRNRRLRRR